MVPALSKKLEGVVKLHHAADREDAIKCGFWKDGESTIYHRIELPDGGHVLSIGMSDSGRTEGFDFKGQSKITLAPGQHLVVEFDHLQKTFIFR